MFKKMNEDSNFIMNNNTTSIEVNYSKNRLPLWAKKELQIDYTDEQNEKELNSNRLKNSSLVQNKTNLGTSINSSRTRINLYNRSTDSDEKYSIEENNSCDIESPLDRLKKKAQALSINVQSDKNKFCDNQNEDNDFLTTKRKNPLYISSENLKYNDNFYSKSPLNKNNTLAIKPSPAQKPVALINNSTPKVLTNTKTNTMNSNRPALSKRREELSKALFEARAKLQNLDVNRKSMNGLTTSMSVANINRLPLNIPKDNQPTSKKINMNNLADNEAVRRSISLSDLSHNQSLNNSLSVKQQGRNKLNSSYNVYYPLRNLKKNDTSATEQGLWDVSGVNSMNNTLNKSDQLNYSNGGTMSHKPIRVRMSRSSSMASINKNDSLARNSENYNKPQGLWNSPSSLSINTLRSNSNQNNYNKFNHSKLSNRKSSDDESSSDENDLYHRISQRPSTPPKPNIFRQLRRSSTTTNNLYTSNNNNNSNTANLSLQSYNKQKEIKSNRKTWSNNFELRPAKSEYNLNSMGHDTLNSPSSGFWSNQSNGTVTNGGLKRTSSKQNAVGFENYDLANINPATVTLSNELFQHIIDELNHLATFAKKLHYRAKAENNKHLCDLLVEGISKAYVNLATIVPSSSMPSNNFLNLNKPLIKEENGSTTNSHLESSNTDPELDEDNLLSPTTNEAAVNNISLTSDSASSSLPQESIALNLLQHYSERLLSMVEKSIVTKKLGNT